MISRPEEAGEYWLRKRRDFDPEAYRGKCRCKHTHEEHDPSMSPFRCRARGCSCSTFFSAWVCAACDQYWHDHHTVFETESERRQAGRQVGEFSRSNFTLWRNIFNLLALQARIGIRFPNCRV